MTLRGPVLSDEVGRLLRAVARIPGVGEVEKRLDVHDEPGGVPGLQGAPARRQADRFELMQIEWSPTARLLVALGGASVTLACVRRRAAREALSSRPAGSRCWPER